MARTHPVLLLDQLGRDEYYRRSNLPHREYTKDIVDQYLKNHWEWLEAGRDKDELLHCIWIDLNTAIDELPDSKEEPMRTVVRAYAEGYRAEALVEFTGQPNAGRLVQAGALRIANRLRGNT